MPACSRATTSSSRRSRPRIRSGATGTVLTLTLERPAPRPRVSSSRTGEDDALARSLPSWPPFPEVPAALEEARGRGWRLAILSNTDRDFIAASKVQLGIPFDETIVASEIGSYKPGHRHWQEFFARTHADRDRHVHVAASLFHDIVPATRARPALRLGEPSRRDAPTRSRPGRSPTWRRSRTCSTSSSPREAARAVHRTAGDAGRRGGGRRARERRRRAPTSRSPTSSDAAEIGGWWARLELPGDSMLVFDPAETLVAYGDARREDRGDRSTSTHTCTPSTPAAGSAASCSTGSRRRRAAVARPIVRTRRARHRRGREAAGRPSRGYVPGPALLPDAGRSRRSRRPSRRGPRASRSRSFAARARRRSCTTCSRRHSPTTGATRRATSRRGRRPCSARSGGIRRSSTSFARATRWSPRSINAIRFGMGWVEQPRDAHALARARPRPGAAPARVRRALPARRAADRPRRGRRQRDRRDASLRERRHARGLAGRRLREARVTWLRVAPAREVPRLQDLHGRRARARVPVSRLRQGVRGGPRPRPACVGQGRRGDGRGRRARALPTPRRRSSPRTRSASRRSSSPPSSPSGRSSSAGAAAATSAPSRASRRATAGSPSSGSTRTAT